MNVYAHLLYALALLAPAVAAESAGTIPNYVLATRIIYGTQPLILDVRSPEEYAAGHIPGAVNISHDQLAERYTELNQLLDTEIVVYCRSGRRARAAEQMLQDLGFSNVADLEGHWLDWDAAALNVETVGAD